MLHCLGDLSDGTGGRLYSEDTGDPVRVAELELYVQSQAICEAFGERQ